MEEFPYLLIHNKDEDQSIPFTVGTSWTLGRGPENTIVLKDKWTSRNHAVIQIMDSGNFYLIDLGSSNGSFVNGRRVSIPVALQSGDRVTLGTTDMELIFPKPQTSNTPVVRPQRSTVMLQTRRLITVLVVDIRNFTVLTRQLEEHILSQVIGSWFGKAGEIIRQYGSGVDKYIGDAVMAVWVHNTVDNSDKLLSEEIVKVFKALQALQQVSEELNQKFALPFHLRIGAGINTGNAIVGQMGAGDRPEYTALGDTVNAAFRLESATKEIAMDIAIGETTYKNLPYAAELGKFQQHQLMLKGYDVPTVAYASTFTDLDTFLSQVNALKSSEIPPS